MKPLREYAIEDFDKLSAAELKELCNEHQIVAKNKSDRIAALRTARQQADGTYHTNISKCRHCASEVYVTNRHIERISDVRYYLVRHIKCKGRAHHRYTLKQIIEG